MPVYALLDNAQLRQPRQSATLCRAPARTYQYWRLSSAGVRVTPKSLTLHGEAPGYFTANYAINPNTNPGFTLSANSTTGPQPEHIRPAHSNFPPVV